MMKRLTTGTLLALSLLVLFASCATSSKPSPYKTVYITYTVLASVGEEKAARNPTEQKMSSGVLALFRQYKANGDSFEINDTVSASELFLQPSQAKVDAADLVNVYLYTADVYTPAALDSIDQGVTQNGGYSQPIDTTVPFIQSWVPAASLDSLAMLPSVRSIAFVTDPLINSIGPKGGVRLRADAAMNLLSARTTIDKVKVGVLSDDCGTAEGELAQSIANGRLKESDEALAEKDDSYWRTHEGLAMMEIVHDVDSTADLRFATAVGSDANVGMITFRQNIQALVDDGCKVITDDILYLEEAAFEDGAIAKKINEIGDKVVYVSAAGNWAKNVYSFKFAPKPGVTFGALRTWQTGAVHDVGSGYYKNDFMLPDGQYLQAMLQWDDPFGHSLNDFDLFLVDVASGVIVSSSTNVQNGEGSKPYEHLLYEPIACWGSKGYRIYVKYYGSNNEEGLPVAAQDSNATPRMKLLILGPDVDDDPPQDGSIFGHANSSVALAVGAMYADGNYNGSELWSSRGNAEIVDVHAPVDPLTGNRPLNGGKPRLKPDVASLDRVYTSVANFPTFWGTSAAAPHIAGIAALIIKANPTLSPKDIRELIRTSSIDYDLEGIDNISGYGRTDAFICVARARAAESPTNRFALFMTEPAEANAPTSLDILVPATMSFSGKRMYVCATIDGYEGATDLELVVMQARSSLSPGPPITAIMDEFLIASPGATSSFPDYPNIVFTDRATAIVPSIWPVGLASGDQKLLIGSGAVFDPTNMDGTWRLQLRSGAGPLEGVRLKSWGIYIE